MATQSPRFLSLLGGGGGAATIAIRDLDDDPKRRLRIWTAEHGSSMQEEAWEIRRHAVGRGAPHNLAAAIHAPVASFRGIEVKFPEGELMVEPPRFDGHM